MNKDYEEQFIVVRAAGRRRRRACGCAGVRLQRGAARGEKFREKSDFYLNRAPTIKTQT